MLIVAGAILLLLLGLATLRHDDALAGSAERGIRFVLRAALILWVFAYLLRRRLLVSRHADPANSKRRRNALDLSFGIKRRIDNARAEALLRKAYADGDRLAGAALAALLRSENGHESRWEVRNLNDDCIVVLNRELKKKNPEAAFLVCWQSSMNDPFMNGENHSLLKRYLPACCEARLIEAWYLWGMLHAGDSHMAYDIDTAINWLTWAAAEDCCLAKAELGRLLSDPALRHFNMSRALTLLEQAAAGGHEGSKLKLADIQLHGGRDVTRNPGNALAWLERVEGPLKLEALLKMAAIRMDVDYGLPDFAEARRLLDLAQPLLDGPAADEASRTAFSALNSRLAKLEASARP